MMMDYSKHKVRFHNFIAPNRFLKIFRLFFIQLIFMYEVGKCPKHSRSESLPILRHCRDPFESWPSPRNIKIFKNQRQCLYHSYFWKRSFKFRYFKIISSWKKVGPFICTNMSPHHLKMLCAKFG